MATIPRYDSLQAGTHAPGPVYFDPGQAPGADAIGARQMQDAGQAMSGAGAAAAKIAADMQREVDATRVNDALNQARQQALDLTYSPDTGYARLKGVEALQRPDGQALPEEYGTKLRARLDSIAGTLSTGEQRREFQRQADALATQFGGQVQNHLLQEFKAHSLSVQDGTLKLASDEAKRNWSDPSVIGPALQRADAAVVQKGKVLGWAATEIDAARLQTSSAVHSSVILEALANGNASYASGYFATRRSQMTADDILKVEGHVQKAQAEGVAQQAVQVATQQAMPRVAPTPFDRIVEITRQSESGGRELGPDGRILTSPKGAKGSMQVLDSTMANPGLPGVQPLDPKTATPEQRAKFGQRYLQALLQRYGNPAHAWAAYNAGYGAVDKALAAAKADGLKFRGQAPADLWLQKLPQETQAYVRKNMAALTTGGGAAPAPTELEFVNSAVGALPPGTSPLVVQTTRERATQQFGIITKSRAETAEATVSAAQRWLAGNPGARVDQLPPQLSDAVKLHAPGKLDELMAYAKAINTRDVQTDLVAYNRLAANPELLRRLSDSDFEGLRAKLSEADFKHFAGQRGAMLNPKASSGTDPGNLDAAAVKGAVDDHLRALQIDPTPKDDGGADAARVGAIRKFVTDSVLRAQSMSGKRFTDSEVRDTVGRLFAEQGTVSHWIGKDTAAAALTMRKGDIPAKVRESLAADFKRMGVGDPTEAQLLGAYWSAMQRTTELKQAKR